MKKPAADRRHDHGGARPGAGRPAMGDLKRITLTVRIRPGVHVVLGMLAVQRETSFGEVIESLVTENLHDLKLDV